MLHRHFPTSRRPLSRSRGFVIGSGFRDLPQWRWRHDQAPAERRVPRTLALLLSLGTLAGVMIYSGARAFLGPPDHPLFWDVAFVGATFGVLILTVFGIWLVARKELDDVRDDAPWEPLDQPS